jgi:hypothetical protein
MNKLTTEERTRVVAALVEGNSLRAVTRMTGVHRTTIQNLLVDLGKACSEFQDKAFQNLSCKRIHCDEIWSYVGSKAKNTTTEKRAQGCGDCWTWVALGMRRFTRLTNGFSKKLENHEHAIALHFMYYNFCRIHQTCVARQPRKLELPITFGAWMNSSPS